MPPYTADQGLVMPFPLVAKAPHAPLHWWSELSVPPYNEGQNSVCPLTLVVEVQCAPLHW